MNKKIICKITELTVLICIALILHSCNKDGYLNCFNNMSCDINGEAYKDQDETLLPIEVPMTPWLKMWDDNDSCIIKFNAICRPTKNKESLHTYELYIRICDMALPIGVKHEISSSSILNKEFMKFYQAKSYYDSTNISYVEVYDDETDKYNLGDGYFEITSKENNTSSYHPYYYLGEINIKVKLPIDNADSTLNIKGKFRTEL